MTTSNDDTCCNSETSKTPEGQVHATTAMPAQPEAVRLPAVDVRESEDGYVLTVDLPGVAPGDVDLSFEKDVLTVRGRRVEEPTVERRLLHGGFSPVTFERAFRVNEMVDASAITAEGRDGVLTVRLPKRREARSRRIPVQA